MARAELTTVATVHEEGSWLFTVADDYGDEEEVLLVPCEEGIEAWVNKCTHEFQRLDRGFGAPIREVQGSPPDSSETTGTEGAGGREIVCPKHGSTFDTCSGYCDNGKAAETTLVSVAIDIEEDGDVGGDAENGTVFLADESYAFRHEGEIGSDDEGPSSTSHLSF